jgi:hypothetical protein
MGKYIDIRVEMNGIATGELSFPSFPPLRLFFRVVCFLCVRDICSSVCVRGKPSLVSEYDND